MSDAGETSERVIGCTSRDSVDKVIVLFEALKFKTPLVLKVLFVVITQRIVLLVNYSDTDFQRPVHGW